MAQKRIKQVSQDIVWDRIRVLYDDGSQGVLESDKLRDFVGTTNHLIGLTLKQAKLYLGIKD